MEDPKITGYKAMCEFLKQYYNRGKSDEIAIMLGMLSLLEDGVSADPAMLEDWNEAWEKAKSNSIK